MERHPSALACWGGRGGGGRKGREGRGKKGGKRKEGRKRRRGVGEYGGTLEDSSELQLSQAPPPLQWGWELGQRMRCVVSWSTKTKSKINAPERKVVEEQNVCCSDTIDAEKDRVVVLIIP